MFYVVFATVRARASGNEQRVVQRVRQMGRSHTTVLGRSGPLNMLNRRQKWLPRAHSNRALYFWCTLQPPEVRVWRLFFHVSHPFFLKINATARKKNHQKINTVLQQRKHESVMVVSLTSLILFQDFMKVSTFWCGLPSHSQREKYCLVTWPERKQHSTVCKGWSTITELFWKSEQRSEVGGWGKCLFGLKMSDTGQLWMIFKSTVTEQICLAWGKKLCLLLISWSFFWLEDCGRSGLRK